VYTCHSPFVVDADRLDRARKVYVDVAGTSKVTADLREGDAGQRGSAYAVFAAVGLSVAESLLLGCDAVAVEGPSDQHYMTAIKNLLIGAGRLKPGRELVFPPAGGTKGVRAVSSILGGRDEVLPVVLFDSDSAGRVAAPEPLRGRTGPRAGSRALCWRYGRRGDRRHPSAGSSSSISINGSEPQTCRWGTSSSPARPSCRRSRHGRTGTASR